MSTESRNLIPTVEGPLPPLPDPLPPGPEGSLSDEPPIPVQPVVGPVITPVFPFLRSVRCGCYLINYHPNNSLFVTYDGTLRVECHNNGRTASGDLYQRPFIAFPVTTFPIIPSPILGAPPNPASGIPILSRNRYRYYLRVTQILEFATFLNSFTLGFEMYRFTAPNTWANEGAFTAKMTWVPAPPGFPSSSDYLVGDVKNSIGTIVGRLTMGWVSKYLRKATVEIDRVNVSEAPLNNGAGIGWKHVFDEINWELKLEESDSNVAEPSGESWSDAELHQAMLARRAATNLDKEWRFHILAVRQLDSTPRGIMYDAFGTDSNNVPREGVGISSHWVIPNASPWGTVKGMRFGTAAAPYFRTAVHETGHAMGLFHNTVDNGFMNTTDVIANSCPATFPACIKWSFAADDQKRLRHYPDVFVRPGGTAFGTASTTTPAISPTDLVVQVYPLRLNVSPLLDSIPLGAPARVTIDLINPGTDPILAPSSLNMKTGFVRGYVINPSGTRRTFSPVILCVEEQPLSPLEPGKSITESITLLRGREGALFQEPGAHRIGVEVHWDAGGVEYSVAGEANMMVTGLVDEAHSEAALKVISTPDTLLTLVVGGDHLTDGVEAIQAAVNNPVLGPHYSYIEAKRLSERFGKRKPNMKAVSGLINEDTVMSPAEIKKAATMAKKEGEDSPARKSLGKILKKKVKDLGGSDEVKAAVEAV